MVTTKKVVIFQSSARGTGSTLLVNALYGLIEKLKDKKVIGDWHNEKLDNFFDDIFVIKSHINMDHKMEIIDKEKYDLYFVCSERVEQNKFILNRHKEMKNVVVFPYSELNETEENTLEMIVDNIYNKVSKLLEKHDFIKYNKQTAIERIQKMNQKYEEIKDQPFSYIEDFYGLHGHHRNRNH